MNRFWVFVGRKQTLPVSWSRPLHGYNNKLVEGFQERPEGEKIE